MMEKPKSCHSASATKRPVSSTMKTDCRNLYQQRRYRNDHGQAIVEYIVIVALVAMFGLASFKYLGVSIHQSAKTAAENITNR